jgi:hypothetical protein
MAVHAKSPTLEMTMSVCVMTDSLEKTVRKIEIHARQVPVFSAVNAKMVTMVTTHANVQFVCPDEDVTTADFVFRIPVDIRAYAKRVTMVPSACVEAIQEKPANWTLTSARIIHVSMVRLVLMRRAVFDAYVHPI